MIEAADNEYGLPAPKGTQSKNPATTYGAESPQSEFDQYGYPKPINLKNEKIEENSSPKE